MPIIVPFSESLQADVEALAGFEPSQAWLNVMSPQVLAAVHVIAPHKAEDWSTFQSLPPAIYAICVDALAQHLANPKRLRSETVGDYSYSRAGAIDVWFTPQQVDIIKSIAWAYNGAASGTYSVELGSGQPVRPDYADVPLDGILGYPVWTQA